MEIAKRLAVGCRRSSGLLPFVLLAFQADYSSAIRLRTQDLTVPPYRL